jgi:hypothetical protein
LLRTNNQVGNADRGALILACPEIRVDANAAPDEIDDRGGVRIHGRGRNIGVPETVRRKQYKASKTRDSAE